MMILTRPGWLLRIEGAVLLGASVFFYAHLAGNWLLFALLLFAPDLAALGYLINTPTGAALYNLVHSELAPVGLIISGVASGNALLVALGLIWLAHIGLDRMLGFGLKYPTKFQDTHLQRV